MNAILSQDGTLQLPPDAVAAIGAGPVHVQIRRGAIEIEPRADLLSVLTDLAPKWDALNLAEDDVAQAVREVRTDRNRRRNG